MRTPSRMPLSIREERHKPKVSFVRLFVSFPVRSNRCSDGTQTYGVQAWTSLLPNWKDIAVPFPVCLSVCLSFCALYGNYSLRKALFLAPNVPSTTMAHHEISARVCCIHLLLTELRMMHRMNDIVTAINRLMVNVSTQKVIRWWTYYAGYELHIFRIWF